MSIPHPRTERLKTMLNLEAKRAALQGQLDTLHQQLSSIKDQLFDRAVKVIGGRSKATRGGRRKRARRGALTNKILAALEAAGDAGVRVKDLALALGNNAANLHSWFQSTAKRHPRIAKVSRGHYRLAGGATAHAARSKTAAPARVRSAKPKRGALSAGILSQLRAAGSQGMSVKDLAAKLGTKYQNISMWFATTGKKNPAVRKLRPAHYKLVG